MGAGIQEACGDHCSHRHQLVCFLSLYLFLPFALHHFSLPPFNLLSSLHFSCPSLIPASSFIILWACACEKRVETSVPIRPHPSYTYFSSSLIPSPPPLYSVLPLRASRWCSDRTRHSTNELSVVHLIINTSPSFSASPSAFFLPFPLLLVPPPSPLLLVLIIYIYSLEDAKDLARHSQEVGADAVALVAPHCILTPLTHPSSDFSILFFSSYVAYVRR